MKVSRAYDICEAGTMANEVEEAFFVVVKISILANFEFLKTAKSLFVGLHTDLERCTFGPNKRTLVSMRLQFLPFRVRILTAIHAVF